MRRLGLFTLWLMAAGAVEAEPLVTGYERFHVKASSPEAGGSLYSELGCANCHYHGPGLPERSGPVLAGIKDRANGEWLAAFLDAPQQSKAGTMMPALFEGLPDTEKAAQIESVVHYLMSLKPVGKAAKPKVGKHANAERGSARYHQVGCVACHAPTPDFHPAAGAPKPEDFSSRPVPFPDLKAKYSLLSLAAFLGNPGPVRPDGRMPDLGLSEEDSLDIASHLLDFRESDPREAAALAPFTVNGELAQKGAAVAARLNCVACHRLTAEDRPVAVEIKQREQPVGCLSGTPAANRPLYELSEDQRAALVAYVKLPEPPAFTAAQRTDLTLQAMNCPCVPRSRWMAWAVRMPRVIASSRGTRASPPPGGWPRCSKRIGRKLRPEWMTGVSRGPHRARPYVLTRMPKYPTQAEGLTKLLTGDGSREPSGDGHRRSGGLAPTRRRPRGHELHHLPPVGDKPSSAFRRSTSAT
ncbi:MAG: c-type cytochrome [Akkermansiaceae bacterium]|nr:c-type cytochrome [Akkermansiaceae bacterium]